MRGFSNLYLWSDLFSTSTQATRAAESATAEVRDMRARLERMSLLTLAMWTLTRDKLGITEDELADRVQQLDLSDGKLDGKISPGVSECPKCRRKLSPRHQKCLYCGTPRGDVPASF